MMNIKRLIPLMMTLLACILLSGCTKDYSDDDVKKYIREEMKISSFSMIGGPEEIEGEDGYTDRMWTVSTEDFDLEEPLVFHVYDDYRWGMEWVTNSLKDDLEYQKECVLIEDFELPDGFYLEEITDGSGRVNWYLFGCDLEKRADFEKCFDFVNRFKEHAKAYPTLNDIEQCLSFKIKDTGAAADRTMTGRSYSIDFGASSTEAEIQKEMEKASGDYLMDCIEGGVLNRMDEYSVEERSAAIAADELNTEIRRIGEETAAYPGYSYGSNRYAIPYGTLYRILNEEGYATSGAWVSFSFVGDDGNTYAYSYVDDDKFSVEVDEINAATNLNLDDGTELETVVIDAKLLKLLKTDAETFAASLEAPEGDYYRNMEIVEGTVRLTGKGRQFSRLMDIYEDRIDELRELMRTYDPWYGFASNDMHRVYQGLYVRMGADIPREKAEPIIEEAAGLAALCQVINAREDYDWTLEVVFEKMKDGNTEKVLTYVLPEDTIDYKKVYKALK